MVRKLKHHEQKLLKKVDFVNWKHDRHAKEAATLRKYQLTRRDEYVKYMRLCGEITGLVAKLRKLDAHDQVRIRVTEALLAKLYAMGLVSSQRSLAACARIGVSAFCRRRLAVMLVRMHMAPSLTAATRFVAHGHVRVGPEVVADPALLVTRNMEDFVTWVDSSKIKRKVLKYRGQVDDFDLM